jgi:hypothetical protein
VTGRHGTLVPPSNLTLPVLYPEVSLFYIVYNGLLVVVIACQCLCLLVIWLFVYYQIITLISYAISDALLILFYLFLRCLLSLIVGHCYLLLCYKVVRCALRSSISESKYDSFHFLSGFTDQILIINDALVFSGFVQCLRILIQFYNIAAFLSRQTPEISYYGKL